MGSSGLAEDWIGSQRRLSLWFKSTKIELRVFIQVKYQKKVKVKVRLKINRMMQSKVRPRTICGRLDTG